MGNRIQEFIRFARAASPSNEKEEGFTMTRARRRAMELRRELALRGQVDAESVANHLGLEVLTWPFPSPLQRGR